MAKKSSSKTQTRRSNQISLAVVAGCLSFFSILVKGFIWLITWIIVDLANKKFSAGLIGTLADVCLLVAVFICGWLFLITHRLPGRKIVWQIIFIIITILAFLGVINL